MMITKEKQEQIYDDWFHKVGDLDIAWKCSVGKLDVVKAYSIFKLLECTSDECMKMYSLISQNYYTFKEFRVIIGAVLDFDRQYVYRDYLSHGMNNDLVMNDKEDYVLWHYDEIIFDADF
jgi:hypothetical protein